MNSTDVFPTSDQREVRAEDLLPSLPPEARLWIYGASRDLSPADVDSVNAAIAEFLREWSSHGREVYGEATVIDSRFLVIGAHIPSGDISGCGIDKSARVVAMLGEALGVEWIPALDIFFRDDRGQVRTLTRSDFRKLTRDGSVNADTLVYDLTIQDVASLRAGHLLQPASKTWHGRAFRLTT